MGDLGALGDQAYRVAGNSEPVQQRGDLAVARQVIRATGHLGDLLVSLRCAGRFHPVRLFVEAHAYSLKTETVRLLRTRQAWRWLVVDRDMLTRCMADVLICLLVIAHTYEIDLDRVVAGRLEDLSEKNSDPFS